MGKGKKIMRLWSLHPKYLDGKGLVALWREALLAKTVLEGKTKGYQNHPQLNRFKASSKPISAINYYLKLIWLEADNRNYSFDKRKFAEITDVEQINVTIEQINYERKHLLYKLKTRDEKKYDEIIKIFNFETHPLFNLIEGEIELWEKV
ncbi:MAG: pyrimidine dimer DNA glycosylase/endonuclease V [Candidatus Tenebribacter burtonii]|jgi:hypothetical protein|nr:pyrimidine dimer DNA glycosylase/endonuclease V [Candidatus Tenebribacter burtonii]